MQRYIERTNNKNTGQESRPALCVGIDMHRLSWHVTIRTASLEVFSGTLPSKWEALKKLLDRYGDRHQGISVVYEAGYFGFWLYDRIKAYGAECIVTPPSLIPQEYGNRVKTDRRDSRKLASLLSKGLLKEVWVPTEDERHHRQVIRRRRQLIGDRVRIQCRIKAELRFYGIELSREVCGRWTSQYLENLKRLRFKDHWMQESFNRLIEEYECISTLITRQTTILRQLASTELYRDRVKILRTIPGIGLLAAMELLVELQNVERFRRSEKLAAYVGLTPSQFSSAEKIRMGRITGIGKNALRGTLVEASWRTITKDPALRAKYDALKLRAGSKRAIVAIARTVLIRARRILLDRRPYTVGRRAA